MARKRHGGQQLDSTFISYTTPQDSRTSVIKRRIELLLRDHGLRWSKLLFWDAVKRLAPDSRPAFFIGPRCPEFHSGCGLGGAIRYITSHGCLECLMARNAQTGDRRHGLCPPRQASGPPTRPTAPPTQPTARYRDYQEGVEGRYQKTDYPWWAGEGL